MWLPAALCGSVRHSNSFYTKYASQSRVFTFIGLWLTTSTIIRKSRIPFGTAAASVCDVNAVASKSVLQGFLVDCATYNDSERADRKKPSSSFLKRFTSFFTLHSLPAHFLFLLFLLLLLSGRLPQGQMYS